MQLLDASGLKNIEYAEPYAGGAAVALALLFNEYAATVYINDLSRPVYAFWYSVLNETTDLCQRVDGTPITMREWHRQRAVYEQRDSADLSQLGFAAFFLNRTNRSGIIGGGVVGGKTQTGAWGLDARFNKIELIQRIRRISRYRTRISLSHEDALRFSNRVLPQLRNPFTFFDPPYIDKGDTLYLNEYEIEDHRQLAQHINRLEHPWVVTYDYTAVPARLYHFTRRIVYGLPYSAQDRYRGREVMFLSNDLVVPESWRSSRRFLLTLPRSECPLYGKMENMKSHPEMEEGPEAFERFRKAVETVLAVPKAALPPKPHRKKRKPVNRKG